MDGTAPDPRAPARRLATLRAWWAPRMWGSLALMLVPSQLALVAFVLGATGVAPQLRPFAFTAASAVFGFSIAAAVVAWRLDRQVQRALEQAGLRDVATPWHVVRPWLAPGDPPELAAALRPARTAAYVVAGLLAMSLAMLAVGVVMAAARLL